MRAHYGYGGWCRVDDESLPGPVYVRFSEVDDRLAITEVFVDGRGAAVTAATLATLPLAALETWLVADPRDAERVRKNLVFAGPDLAKLVSHLSAGWEPGVHDPVTSSWPDHVNGSAVQPSDADDDREGVAGPGVARLDAPVDGLTREFLERVLASYTAAIATGQPPAEVVAEQAGVTAATVHSWLYTARQRGIRPPANGTAQRPQ